MGSLLPSPDKQTTHFSSQRTLFTNFLGVKLYYLSYLTSFPSIWSSVDCIEIKKPIISDGLGWNVDAIPPTRTDHRKCHQRILLLQYINVQCNLKPIFQFCQRVCDRSNRGFDKLYRYMQDFSDKVWKARHLPRSPGVDVLFWFVSDLMTG